MNDFNAEYIKSRSFDISKDKYSKREGYYNLRFGDNNHGNIITCHKSHLVELARKINTMGELYD